jgi:cyclohexadienyl dehydratase
MRRPSRAALLGAALAAAGALSYGAGHSTAHVTAGGRPADTPARARGKETSAPVLRVCTTGDYKPLTYRDPSTGQYRGIDIDMARDLGRHLHRPVRFVPTTWSTVVRSVTTWRTCDIAMGGISVTPARQAKADFTLPYLRVGKSPLTTRRNAARYRTVKDIDRKGVRLLVNPGGTNEAYDRRTFPKASLIVWPSNVTIFDRLLTGHGDVMVTDSVEARYEAKVHPGLVAVRPEHPFTSEEKAYLLPKGSPLTRRVNTWLAGALRDGTYRHYSEAWLGRP